MMCPFCENDLDPIIRVLDLDLKGYVNDYWCPVCHGTLTEIYTDNASVSQWISG